MLEESRLRVVSALAAPILGVLGAGLVIAWGPVLGPSGGILRRLLAPEGEAWLRIVPGAIVFLLIWAAVDLLFKGLAMIRVRQSIAAARSLREVPKGEVRGRADVVARSSWPLLQSLGGRITGVLDGADPDRSNAQFRHECEIEAERGAGSYGLVRLFIWAMPILGFIGTVMGIGEAVSDFAGFLTGDIEDIEVVKTQLSNVSTGLSFAFDTTLLGLGASLVAMVAVSLVQRQEEGLLSDVERAGSVLLELGAERTHGVGETESVTENAEELARTLRELATGFREQTRALVDASRSLQDEMEPLRASMGAHGEAMALVRAPKDLRESLAPLEDTTRELLEVSKLLSSSVAGLERTGHVRPEAPARRPARPSDAVFGRRGSEGGEPPTARPARDPFWRAPWAASSAETRPQRQEEAHPPVESPSGEEDASEWSETDDAPAFRAESSRNRLAIMWGFGLLFLGTGSAVVAGWLLHRILIPPDLAIVALIIGASFWCMSALSAE